MPIGETVSGSETSAWKTHLGDYLRSNRTMTPVTLPPRTSWESGLTPFFGAPDEVSTTPLVSGGVIYAASGAGYFHAIDIVTGKNLWRFESDSELAGEATLTDSMLCFGSSAGVLHCLDSTTGGELWHFRSRAEVLAAPVITSEAVIFISTDNRVYALSRADGKKLWSYSNPTRALIQIRYSNAPLFDGTHLYHLFSDNTLIAIDAKTGSRLWKVDVAGDKIPPASRRRTPAIDPERGLIYVIGKGGKLVSFSLADGSPGPGYEIVSATDFLITESRLVIADADNERLLAIDRSGSNSGAVLWKTPLPHGPAVSIFSSRDHVYVLSNQEGSFLWMDSIKGYVTAFSLADGAVVWEEELNSVTMAPGAASENHIALITSDGTLRVFGN